MVKYTSENDSCTLNLSSSLLHMAGQGVGIGSNLGIGEFKSQTRLMCPGGEAIEAFLEKVATFRVETSAVGPDKATMFHAPEEIFLLDSEGAVLAAMQFPESLGPKQGEASGPIKLHSIPQ